MDDQTLLKFETIEFKRQAAKYEKEYWKMKNLAAEHEKEYWRIKHNIMINDPKAIL